MFVEIHTMFPEHSMTKLSEEVYVESFFFPFQKIYKDNQSRKILLIIIIEIMQKRESIKQRIYTQKKSELLVIINVLIKRDI